LFGERTYGMGVERTRFLLRQGGAAEVVNKRWLGAGGEFLGAGGEKPEAAQRPLDTFKGKGPAPAPVAVSYGVAPDYVLKATRPDEHDPKGVRPEEDPLPRILEILGTRAQPKSPASPRPVAGLRAPLGRAAGSFQASA
jgi:hypothetical protein